MAPLSVADLLALPVLRAGRPEILAGQDNLDRPVRWVHVSELADIAGLLSGGEVILSTGIALPDSAPKLRAYVDALAGAEAAALVVELGRRFSTLPAVLVRACEQHGLPLIALRRQVAFVRVTEAAHSRIIEAQTAALRSSEQAHQVFTALAVDGAEPADIVREVSRASGCPVVFENLAHQVLSYDAAGTPVDDLLADWEGRSRAARTEERTAICGPEGWLVTAVAARGEVFGRLVMLAPEAPAPDHPMLLERAATALTLNRLMERDRETLEQQAQRSILTDIIHGRYAAAADMHARTAALGVPTRGRSLVAVVVDLPAGKSAGQQRSLRDYDGELVAGVVRAEFSGIVAAMSPGRVGVLLPVHNVAERASVLERVCRRLQETVRLDRGEPARIGVGTTAADLADLRRAFAEAGHVADAARGSRQRKAFYELPDIQLPGLLYVLRDDPRLQAFVERTLAPLLENDRRTGKDMLGVLRAFLRHPDNKSRAAQEAHVSRPAFYGRLTAIEQLLDVDLRSAETRTSLHAAIMALDSLRQK